MKTCNSNKEALHYATEALDRVKAIQAAMNREAVTQHPELARAVTEARAWLTLVDRTLEGLAAADAKAGA